MTYHNQMDKLATGQSTSIDPTTVGGTTVSDTESISNALLLKFIKRRHPSYALKSAHWSFLDSCYEGGREWFIDENIFKYLKEGDTEFKDRLERAYRFNHSREVVDLVNKYLFKQNITRNEVDAPPSVKSFWKNASKVGLSIDDLARQMSLRGSVQGRIGVVIDTNKSADVVSIAEQKESDVRTYAYIVKPEQILDLAKDEMGELLWIKLAEIKRDDKDPISSTGEEKVQYRLWTRTNWSLFEVVTKGRKQTVEVIDSGDHALGKVPVVLIDNVISDRKYDSPALIDDIAYLDRAVANYLSNIDAIIQDQTFSQLVMPSQSVLPGEDSYKTLVEMGTKRMFLFDGAGGAAPAFISPDVKQAELILSIINKIINEIYHTVGLAGERTKQDNAIGIDNSSGVAKAYDFEKVNALLSAKAHSLEIAENEIAGIVALWNGDTIDQNTKLVSYPDNFDTRGLHDEFEIAGNLMLISAPDTARREQMSNLIDKLFPQLSKALKDDIQAQLKDWPPQDVELVAGTSPADNPTKKSGNQGAVGTDTDNAK